MKVYKNSEQFFMDDNGVKTELIPNEDRYLKLPANSVNRLWVSCAKIEKAVNQCIDYGTEVKIARVLGPREGTVERKALEDYLDDKDRKTYLALVEKAKKAREEANKKAPLTDLEKAQRAYERAKARVEALSK